MNKLKYGKKILSLWSNCKPNSKKINKVSKKDFLKVTKALSLKNIEIKNKLIRLFFASFLNWLPNKPKKIFTNILKKIRNKTASQYKDINDFYCVRLLKKLDLPKKKDPLVCISHDVDCKSGYDNIKKIIKMEQKYNFLSSWNFILRGNYSPKKDFLFSLQDMGFEIGLHGLSHDVALAYRPKKQIKTQIEQALRLIDIKIYGFRSPALSISSNLINVLEELGFLYDTSIQDFNRYEFGIETIYPYPYHKKNIWELPITNPQDSELFRDLGLSDQEALSFLSKKIEAVFERGGVISILTHPSIIIDHQSFYKNLLDYLANQKYKIMLPKEIINFYKNES